jgi:hypothetical protein
MQVRPRPCWKAEPARPLHVRRTPAHYLKTDFADVGYVREYGVTSGAPIARTRSFVKPIPGR